jgi:hypothetical protein
MQETEIVRMKQQQQVVLVQPRFCRFCNEELVSEWFVEISILVDQKLLQNFELGL